jgi:hypothetical protein
MDMVLLDWTRMGNTFCLAGVVRQGDEFRVVRPLPYSGRKAPVRNVGWLPIFVHGRCRWEEFELVGPAAASPEAPHLEDVWVRGLRPRGALAPPALRRAILQATTAPAGMPLFGAPLTRMRSSVFLPPGTGCRSLASLAVPAAQIEFSAVLREGADEPDVRVALHVLPFEGHTLPVKDHFLLGRAESASPTLDGRVRELDRAVRQMGPQVAVRLGVSRAFAASPGRAPNACWVMADGFFSLTDPQP